jgi:hypothetical protein
MPPLHHLSVRWHIFLLVVEDTISPATCLIIKRMPHYSTQYIPFSFLLSFFFSLMSYIFYAGLVQITRLYDQHSIGESPFWSIHVCLNWRPAGVFALVGFPSQVRFSPAILNLVTYCSKTYPKIEVIPIQYVKNDLKSCLWLILRTPRSDSMAFLIWPTQCDVTLNWTDSSVQKRTKI